MIANDLQYMRHALQLALKGQGRTSPNPCVGAVIVLDGRIVGQGYHRKAGTPHAEVHAIADAEGKTAGATLYVTLEPCNHTGRTPPCTQAILAAGITRVVVGMPDPNPGVAGGGNAFLAARGIEVASGVLEEECRSINRPFIKHITSGLPWVIMKAGMSLDARISYQKGLGGKITGTESKHLTHELRNTLDAIMIGVETALIDKPSLTTRLPGTAGTRDPLRVILDTRLRLQVEAGLVQQESTAPTWIFCGPEAPKANEERLVNAGAVVHRVAVDGGNRLDLHEVLKVLGHSNITSVLVEGGARIHASMLRQELVDEVYLFIATFFIGQQGTALLGDFGQAAGKLNCSLHQVKTQQLGDDILIHGFITGLSP